MATEPSPSPAPAPAPAGSAPTAGGAAGLAALTQGPPGPPLDSTNEERQLAMVAHIGGILPFSGFLVPLAIYGMKYEESKFVCDQAKEALNFQINVFMISFVAALTIFIYIGWILLPTVLLSNALTCVMAGLAAKEGKVVRYAFNVRYLT